MKALWIPKVFIVLALSSRTDLMAFQAPVQCPVRPLTMPALTQLIEGKVPEKRIILFIDTCRIGFTVDSKSIDSLGKAGATPAVIAEVRKVGAPPKTDDGAELSLWNQTKNSDKAADLERYLDKYPKGRYASQALDRFKELQSQQIEQAITASRWDAAEQQVGNFKKRAGDSAQVSQWTNRIAAGVRDASDRKTAQLNRSKQQVEQAIRERRWDNAEQQIAQFVRDQATFDAAQVSQWRRQIANGKEEDRRAAEAEEAKRQIEQSIRERRWDNANQQVTLFIRDHKNLFDAAQLSGWQRQIAEGRDEDQRASNIRRFEQQVTQAIQDRRWHEADSAINQVAQINPNYSQIAAWRRTVSAGRAAGQTGSVALLPGEYFDLEAGQKTGARGTGHLMFAKNASGGGYLIALRDTSFGMITGMTYDRVTADNLRTSNLQKSSIDSDSLGSGAIIGVRTKTGVYGKLRIDRSGGALELTWTVYK